MTPFLSSRRHRGAALVEFAMIAVLFFTLLLGMVQFGIYQSTTGTLWNLSREGARFATVSTPDNATIDRHIRDFAPPNIQRDKLVIDIYPATRVSGQAVTINVTYDMADKIIFPGAGVLLKRDRIIAANPATSQPEKVITDYNYFTASTMRVE